MASGIPLAPFWSNKVSSAGRVNYLWSSKSACTVVSVEPIMTPDIISTLFMPIPLKRLTCFERRPIQHSVMLEVATIFSTESP